MPAVQETMVELFCLICSEAMTEENTESYENVHDFCVDEVTWQCESCTDLYLQDIPNASAIASTTGIGHDYHIDTEDGYRICGDCAYYCQCDMAWANEDSADNCCRNTRYVNNYSYRPQFKFYSDSGMSLHPQDGVLYMGIELEMVRVAECAEDFLEDAGENVDDPDFFYFKEDGSVGYNGAELVTMPATLASFERNFPFSTLDWARKHHRVRSFEYDCCGFHIHVSRKAFTDTHLWKFVRFQLKNPTLCQKIGQRESSTYATWHFDSTENSSIPAYVKGKYTNGRRYLAINFQNRSTVELRYFKGNILRSAIMKNLEFVQSIYDYTKHMSYQQVLDGGLMESQYRKWLFEQDSYPNLKQFLIKEEY